MSNRILLSLLLVSASSTMWGMYREEANSESCFKKCKKYTKEVLLCPGETCMTTSPDDIMNKSLRDCPLLSLCFDARAERKECHCYNEWNFLPVSIVVVAAGIYGLTRKPVLDKALKLLKCIKTKFNFGSKKHNEEMVYRKVAQWREEMA